MPRWIYKAITVLCLLLLWGAPAAAELELVTNQLQGPLGVSVANNGNLLVADYIGQAIVEVTPQGNARIHTAGIAYPIAVVMDQEGRVFATRDNWGVNVAAVKGHPDNDRLYDEIVGLFAAIAGPGTVGANHIDAQEGIIAGRAGGMRLLPDGNLLVCLRAKGSGAIVFDRYGRILFNHAVLRPNRLVFGADIVDLEVSPGGNLVLSDARRKAILVFRRDRIKPLVLVGEGLEEPWGITFGGDGSLYITDRQAGKLYRMVPGQPLELLASGLDQPAGVVWNQNDNRLYLTTYGDGALWRYIEPNVGWGYEQ